MKKIAALFAMVIMLSGCSILSELTAIRKCEFSFHSAQDPVISGIDVMKVSSFADLSLMDGQKVLSNIMQKKLPFGITVNVEVKNPGVISASLSEVEYIAYIDDIEISTGKIDKRVEIPANGGTALVPVRIETDLFKYMEEDNPKKMLNFGLNLIDAGGQPTRLSMKIKPSVYIGGTKVTSPEYFTIAKEFKSQ